MGAARGTRERARFIVANEQRRLPQTIALCCSTA
jgi:hypothetical protein